MKISINGKEKEVKVEEPTENDIEEFLDIVADLQVFPKNETGEPDIKAIKVTMQHAKKLLARLTSATEEDIGNMKLSALQVFLKGVMAELMGGAGSEKEELLKNSKPPSP